MGAPDVQIIKPQVGPQENFLACSADIVIYGGAAGSGKSWAVLLEPLRHAPINREFAAVFFRRNSVQVRNPGGLWDESMKIYPRLGATPISHILEWQWRPKGGKIKFAHLEHDTTVLDWQGAQIPLIVFDELTHFTEQQFFYMLSRNRSMCGVRPYVRATTNPDADSWVAKLIAWWIDDDGYPIHERSGIIRWFIRLHDAIIWGDTREALVLEHGNPEMAVDDPAQPVQPKSFTFISAKLDDNPALTRADPGYRANLMAMSRVERERLLGGNWKIRPAAGLYFKRQEVQMVDTVPDDVVMWVRRWDLAATEPGEGNPDPDWTAGLLMGKRASGKYIIADCIRERRKSHRVRELVVKTASHDGTGVKIGISQDPGQAGKEQAENYVQLLAGYAVRVFRETGDKVVRADPFAAQWQAGNIEVLRGPWNEALFAEYESFPSKGVHDDQVDAGSGAFSMLTKSRTMFDVL